MKRKQEEEMYCSEKRMRKKKRKPYISMRRRMKTYTLPLFLGFTWISFINTLKLNTYTQNMANPKKHPEKNSTAPILLLAPFVIGRKKDYLS